MRKIIITWVLLFVLLIPAHSVCAFTWRELYLQFVMGSTVEQESDQNTTEAWGEDDDLQPANYGVLLFLLPWLMHTH